MLTPTLVPDVPEAGAGVRRALSRTLSLVLAAALGSRNRARFAVELLDARRVPVFASAGDLTPYGAELLVAEVLQTDHRARIDLFVGPERAAAFRLFASRQIGQLRHHGLAIHVHE